MSKLICAVFLAMSLLRTGAKDDRVAMFSTIDVTAEEPAGDIACLFCTVNLHGDVQGDMAVIFGTVKADADRTITGDVAAVFSTVRLGENDHVNGDLASVLSTMDIPQSASVGGSRAVVTGGAVMAALIAPVFVIIGVIWLIVHLVRRNRYPYPV